ncbi:hypothetical protein AX15_003794 [Amanita polypyramis BW_CC]|nr:hypothetical protein AX15_003794 [Amanita polypyramis BW_CC]
MLPFTRQLPSLRPILTATSCRMLQSLHQIGRTSSSPIAMKYITGEQLAEIIKSDRTPNKDYLVIDVRDDDFRGGNIKHAVNMPSNDFSSTVNNLVESAKNVPLLVFHCALSQMRGPTAARVYEEVRHNLLGASSADKQEVVVLRDGFSQFQLKFKDDPQLVEKWDKDVWTSDWW